MKVRTLDIVLPCYNPPTEWAEDAVDSFESLQSHLNLELGLIVVNDGSSVDLTEDFDLLKSRLGNLKLIEYDTNKGKGAALRKGVSSSKADAILLTDCDFPYQQASMLKVIRTLLDSSDHIVAGVRNQQYYKHVPSFRKTLSKVYRRILKRLVNLEITDTQCGLKALSREAIPLFLKTETNRYLFDLEFLAMASQKSGIRIKPVLVNLKDGVTFSRMSPVVLITEFFNFVRILLKA